MSSPLARPVRRYALAAFAAGVLLAATFAALVLWLRSDLRAEIHAKIIERNAAVLYPMALEQLAETDSGGRNLSVTALLRSAQQPGMLGVAVFDASGNTLDAVPSTQILVELPTDDFLRLQGGVPISRYHPAFPLDQYFSGVGRDQPGAPVLEVLLALPGGPANPPRGFVRYFIDARPLARELELIDRRTDRQAYAILGVGTLLIALLLTGAAIGLQRAQRVVEERTERLARINFELTLAAKASAIGQIASHLIHGMQGSVEGLRSFVATREAGADSPHWHAATDYAERLQRMIRDTVALLSDTSANASYEYSGPELAAIIRERHAPAASAKGVAFTVDCTFAGMIDSHRGSLLCLIAHNLVQNALAATPAGATVTVRLDATDGRLRLIVADEGTGISPAIREHLFQPGRSGRPGGSGLGLAISRLLARQIGADLRLETTSERGSSFVLDLPLQPQSGAG
ncbi:MAG TPA: sensor histidine kinase [Candidatus Didemnitutus sp.]|nr:sensor histidine kinase [Candidatus Didemnitutus sp.]